MVHDACPDCDWCFPASQRLQTEAPGCAALPASHCVGTALPVAQAWPCGHEVQSEALVRLVALPYVPLSHSKAALAPSEQCAPSSHGKQAVAF